jgi:hypothetical protein
MEGTMKTFFLIVYLIFPDGHKQDIPLRVRAPDMVACQEMVPTKVRQVIAQRQLIVGTMGSGYCRTRVAAR